MSLLVNRILQVVVQSDIYHVLQQHRNQFHARKQFCLPVCLDDGSLRMVTRYHSIASINSYCHG
eukprot:SAG31_NODE_34625_length_331_cov_0.672414_1_plen_63_part_10